MSIYTDYKLIRTAKGENATERHLNRDKKELANALATSPTSSLVTLENKQYQMIVVSRRQDIESFDKKFTCSIDTPMNEGSVIEHKENKWLIIHNQDSEYEVAKTGIGRRVTNEVKFFIGGKQVLVPIISAMTFNSADAIDRKIMNAVTYDGVEKSAVIIMPKNEDTAKISLYTRFLIGQRAMEITFVNSEFRGLVICSARIVDINSRVDNVSTKESIPLKENIVIENKESHIVSYEIKGTQEFFIGEEVIYQTNFDATYTVDNPALVSIVNQTSNTITLKGLAKGKTTINAFKDGEKKVTLKIKIVGLI